MRESFPTARVPAVVPTLIVNLVRSTKIYCCSVNFTVKFTDMSYKRELQIPKRSFFLFGPRGTGKSTWLKECYKPDLCINLLKSSEYLELSADPGSIAAKINALPNKSRVVIDEIQKLPQLLDEVHSLIFERENEIQFALTGSSARKLKKNKANLLAGRALRHDFWGLNSFELGSDFDIEHAMSFGSLPAVINLKSKNEKIDYLMSYVETYLKEEIQEEAAVRNLSSYHRFLKHAALMNAQVLNLNNISKEASVARSTLDGYFNIVDETLLGRFVAPIHLKAKVKEVATPKFYFFDCGVVRALRNELSETISETEKGFLLETVFLNEILSLSSYRGQYWEVYYWGTPSKNEVDFIITKGKKKIAIEIKSATKWREEFHKTIAELLDAKKVDKGIGIYLGRDKLKFGPVEIFPLSTFLNLVHQDPSWLL